MKIEGACAGVMRRSAAATPAIVINSLVEYRTFFYLTAVTRNSSGLQRFDRY